MKIQKINGLTFNQADVKKTKAEKTSSQNYKEINELSNVYYKPLSFGRTKAEHKSWGAQIDPKTKEATFKVLTYPDSKKVVVTVVKANDPNSQKEYELVNKGKGIFETAQKIPAGEVEHGDKYFYTIHKGNGNIDKVKDPYSYRQDKLLGESVIYDHSLYEWKDADWFKNNKNRISAKANSSNNLKTMDEAKIYEMHTGTFTKRGNFETAKKMLKGLVEEGFNAIELMPVENTYSFNWGYDGVDKFAPSEHLGGPDQLKDFVDYAHSVGLNVIMDIVPNHLGPDGASLKTTGPFIGGENCFGEKFNYEGENSEYVKDYIVNAALNWVDNYHCDGLRLDMTKFMESDNTMKQIAAEVNYHNPDVFLIAEDGRSGVSVDYKGNSWANPDEIHDKRVISDLEPYEFGEGQTEEAHAKAIDNIIQGKTNLSRLGYDSEWDFNFFHKMKQSIYGSINLDELEKACYCAQDTIKYIMSHDEIGNFEGTRLIPKVMVPMLNLNDNVILSYKDNIRAINLAKQKGISEDEAKNTVKVQKAQFLSEKLATMLLEGKLDRYKTEGVTSKRWLSAINEAFNEEILKSLGIKFESGINYDRVANSFQNAFDRQKMALARTYSIPGPKMVFQGDERADITPFRFFRQFDSIKNEDYLENEKGYKTGYSAFDASKLGTKQYSYNARTLMNKHKFLMKELNRITSENSALTKGVLIPEDTVKHTNSQVFATHAYDSEKNNHIFSVTNFMDASYPRQNSSNYYIKFPAGKWVELVNTDDKRFGGTGNYVNSRIINSNGYDNVAIKLAGQSTSIFRRID